MTSNQELQADIIIRARAAQTPKEQNQLCQTPDYISRVFVTGMKQPIDLLRWIHKQHASAENRIKEANTDAGLAAHRSGQYPANRVHSQLAMLAKAALP